MGIFLHLLAVLNAALPLPVWTDKTSVAAWLHGLEEPLSVLISTLMGQLAKGDATIELPSGGVVAITETPQGKLYMADHHLDLLAEVLEAEIPTGKWLDLLLKYLPLILEIFGMFFKPSPTPTPVPPPGPITV